MTRAFAFAFVKSNGPLMTEALETIVGKRPETPDPVVRPLGVSESESKRGVQPGTSTSEENTSASDVALALSPVLVPDFGTEGATLQPVALGVAVDPLAAAPSSGRVSCAECGVALHLAEIERIPRARGTKFEQLCNECTRLALGLL